MPGRVVFILVFTIMTLFVTMPAAEANTELARYVAADGFLVVSYSKAWADQEKLKEVYEELLRNKHGDEIKLLTRINIFPGPDPEGSSYAGKYYGEWRKGKPELIGNRYIDIYKGDELTTIESIARTLAHEYGHHFTYYYFFKKEKQLWENWRNTGLAAARNLKNNLKVSATSAEHKWLIQEIAAEDYVQLFGSPTLKKSFDFEDVQDSLDKAESGVTIYRENNSDMYNYHPQENYELPLAANVRGLKEYWLGAAGWADTLGGPPEPVTPELLEVNRIRDLDTPQYVFAWNRSTDDTTAKLEYTLVRFVRVSEGGHGLIPVKTVNDDENLTAYIGAAANSRMYIEESIPKGITYFILFVKDGDGMITSSDVLAVDFTDPWNPQSVVLDEQSVSDGVWFWPRVVINKKQIDFDVPPVIQNQRLLVPLRAVFEELGAHVQWDGLTRTITAEKGEKIIYMSIDETKAVVNDSITTLEVPPIIKDNRTLIPLRFVSEALGADVGWNDRLKTAFITSG